MVFSELEALEKVRKLKQEKYFLKATHNSYAYRICGDYGVLE